MRLRPDHEQPGREILAWRWFSLALPPLLFSGAAMPLGISPPNWIQVLDPSLIPRGPVAHLHLHLGAVYPFELLWSHLASAVRFDEVNDPPSGMRDVAEWKSWLTRALLARRILSTHTYHPTPSPLGTCRSCLDDSDVSLASDELIRGSLDSTNGFRDARLARFARRVSFRRRPVRHISDVWYNDPLGGTNILPEAVFLARSFSYLSHQQEIYFTPVFGRNINVYAASCIIISFAIPLKSDLQHSARVTIGFPNIWARILKYWLPT